MADISVIGEGICTQLGEGPTWDTTTQKLLFVDALDYSVHVLDVETGKVRVTKTNNTRGFFKILNTEEGGLFYWWVKISDIYTFLQENYLV